MKMKSAYLGARSASSKVGSSTEVCSQTPNKQAPNKQYTKPNLASKPRNQNFRKAMDPASLNSAEKPPSESGCFSKPNLKQPPAPLSNKENLLTQNAPISSAYQASTAHVEHTQTAFYAQQQEAPQMFLSEQVQMGECATCKRSFNLVSLLRHEKVCVNVFQSKRK